MSGAAPSGRSAFRFFVGGGVRRSEREHLVRAAGRVRRARVLRGRRRRGGARFFAGRGAAGPNTQSGASWAPLDGAASVYSSGVALNGRGPSGYFVCSIKEHGEAVSCVDSARPRIVTCTQLVWASW